MTNQIQAVLARGRGRRPPAGQPGQPGQPAARFRLAWSVPAAYRALRITLVAPCLFALTFKVFGDLQMAVFAVFGSFAALLFASFGGTRRDKAIAHLGLAITGSLALIIGTVVSGSIWLSVLVTIGVAFAIFFAGVAGPNAATGVTAALLAYVLPVASAGSASTIGSRLAGWWLASAASTLAVLLLSPSSAGDRLRACAAESAATLSAHLPAAVGGTATAATRDASVAAQHALMEAFAASPYRPTGLAVADQALVSTVHLLEWCTSLVCDAMDGHVELQDAAAADKELLGESAVALHDVAELLHGAPASPRLDLDRVWQFRVASAGRLRELSGDEAAMLRQAEYGFHAQTIAIAASAAVAQAMVAAGRAGPEEVAVERSRISEGPLAGSAATGTGASGRLPGRPAAPAAGRASWRRAAARVSGLIAVDASLRSVWFRNSARGALALAAAVLVAKLTDLQHAFWVVLGTLSVLRGSAAATGSTALRALAGTVVGFVVGAGLLLAIGTDPVALWVAFPLAVLAASYAQGTAPFFVGQAAFTVTIVVLFNILDPVGWHVGLLRVEDVATGCAVSVVVGLLFWPRGASSVVGNNLADAFHHGAAFLSDATSWAVGEIHHRPERAAAAVAAATRLDDAVRGYLNEQGSKRVSKQDLWKLVMGAMRLRLTAHSMASMPSPPEHQPDGSAAHGVSQADRVTLTAQSTQVADFYRRIASEVGTPHPARPGDGAAMPLTEAELSQPAERGPDGLALGQCRSGVTHYHPEALWVRHHLAHLRSHAADVTGPADRLAAVHRRPWWR